MKPQLIGYACDLGANVEGSAKGPEVLQNSSYLKPLQLDWLKILHCQKGNETSDAIHHILAVCEKLAIQVMHRTREKHPFLTIGGDHSMAIGTWNGAMQGLKESVGLIWIDAHMDSHTFKTSHTKNIHGMPLATLLGYGDHQLTHLEKNPINLEPDNIALIGVRSFEPEEEKLLNLLKVRIYKMDEVHHRGLVSIMQEAINHVTQKTNYFGISLDLDAIDPQYVPGISTPEEDGLSLPELLKAFMLVAKNSHFIGAEIAEFNPDHDKDHLSEKAISEIIKTLFQC